MIFILDTNVLNERPQPTPDARGANFLRAISAGNVRVSSLVLAEIAQGVEINPTPDLQLFLAEVLTMPVAGFGKAAAWKWGPMTSAALRQGRPLEMRDTLIAATALAPGWTVATRNISDFAPLGVQVFNPWTDRLRSSPGSPSPRPPRTLAVGC